MIFEIITTSNPKQNNQTFLRPPTPFFSSLLNIVCDCLLFLLVLLPYVSYPLIEHISRCIINIAPYTHQCTIIMILATDVFFSLKFHSIGPHMIGLSSVYINTFCFPSMAEPFLQHNMRYQRQVFTGHNYDLPATTLLQRR